MDGLVTKSSILTSLLLGTSLFGGFVSGLTLSPAQLLRLNPFHTETIRFGKISWISSETKQDFKVAEVKSMPSMEVPIVTETDPVFVPYQLHAAKHRHYSAIFNARQGNFLKLQSAMTSIEKATRYDAFSDYQIATVRLRNEFALALNELPASSSGEILAMTASSAEKSSTSAETKEAALPIQKPAMASVPDKIVSVPASSDGVTVEKSITPENKVSEKTTLSYEEQAAIADLEISKDPVSRAFENIKQGSLTTPLASTVDTTQVEKMDAALKASAEASAGENAKIVSSTAETAPPASTHAKNENVDVAPTEDMPLVTVDRKNANIMAMLLSSQKVNTQNISNVPNESPVETSSQILATESPPDKNEEVNTTADETVILSTTEQKKLSEAMLNVQLKTSELNRKAQLAQNTVTPSPLSLNIDEEYDSEEPVQPPAASIANSKTHALVETKPAPTANGCKNLTTQKFIRAGGSAATDVATQVCPANLTWIARSGVSSGWLKVEGEDYYPTLTLEPAPNNGSTLLLDTNALGVLSIKSGIHVTKGMGIILGLVPDGYKINFMGRGEETEYFDSTGDKYFAILNVEPGAGVVEVESNTNPNISSTVFVPVLGDVISYLDLAAPIARNLKIKIVKNGMANDPDVSKLTVGLSTQPGLQAITRADGQATLNNVNVVPGFPVFIDVASRNEDTDSFTYRYEMKHPESGNLFVANEVNDKTIRRWLKQVTTGLSDQSAMVIGLYDRKKLNGFKSIHYSQVEPLTERSGLDPINYSVLWNGVISTSEPLEGDLPRFMSVQVPEGLSNIKLLNEIHEVEASELFPISPRVIHVLPNY